jgi:hypothetical protein
VFIWKAPRNGWIKQGQLAGNLRKDGYMQISVTWGLKRKLFLSHRLAWFYVYGVWPKNQIDHINGVRIDNKIENLRDVTIRENNQNVNRHRNGSLVGCCFRKKYNNWEANIKINGKQKYLGVFNTEQEAHSAYMVASNQAITLWEVKDDE